MQKFRNEEGFHEYMNGDWEEIFEIFNSVDEAVERKEGIYRKAEVRRTMEDVLSALSYVRILEDDIVELQAFIEKCATFRGEVQNLISGYATEIQMKPDGEGKREFGRVFRAELKEKNELVRDAAVAIDRLVELKKQFLGYTSCLERDFVKITDIGNETSTEITGSRLISIMMNTIANRAYVAGRSVEQFYAKQHDKAAKESHCFRPEKQKPRIYVGELKKKVVDFYVSKLQKHKNKSRATRETIKEFREEMIQEWLINDLPKISDPIKTPRLSIEAQRAFNRIRIMLEEKKS